MKQNILTNTKIHVKNEEESRKVQELAFSLGYRWFGEYFKISKYIDKPYLYFDSEGTITYNETTYGFDMYSNKLITFKELFPMEQKQKTKCIVLGQNEDSKKELKPIEFVNAILLNTILKTASSPTEYKNIELVCRNYVDVYDLMFAYDEDRSKGCAYLGYWNDGIV